jgi:1-deoxy-D-xylulose-5-phosphate reductoisomerase
MEGDENVRVTKHLVLLGSTGSIGCQALEVLPHVPGVRLVGLAAGRGADAVVDQALRHDVSLVALHDEAAAAAAAARHPELGVLRGEAGLAELIDRAAEGAAAAGATLTVLNGIVGAAGLRATMSALSAGAELALANKESMVAGGPFVLDQARRSGARIIPVDSEHSALFQCLALGGERAVEELLLTGSGGPFRGRTAAELAAVTAAEALQHPTWAMGPKITIDSATLMNKGLEVIEAHYLFGVPYERITVVISPTSTVHSMARFSDGAVLAHLGAPDMRTPIGYAVAYPERPALPMVTRLDLSAATLAFSAPDETTFRCLTLARDAGRAAAIVECEAGREGCAPRTVAAPIVLNAANEVAVQAFLDGDLGFLDIAAVVEKCLAWLGGEPVESLDDVYDCDAEARRFAAEAAAGAAR